MQFDAREQRLRFVESSPASSCTTKEVFFLKISCLSAAKLSCFHEKVMAMLCHSISFFSEQDIRRIFKRRGGNDNKDLLHHEWLNTVQLEPDVISMSFVPITSLLNGVPGSGFLSHAINLYLRCEYEISIYNLFSTSKKYTLVKFILHCESQAYSSLSKDALVCAYVPMPVHVHSLFFDKELVSRQPFTAY